MFCKYVLFSYRAAGPKLPQPLLLRKFCSGKPDKLTKAGFTSPRAKSKI